MEENNTNNNTEATSQETARVDTAVPESPKAEPVTETNTPEKTKKVKPKWFLPAILAGLLVLGGGAAAYLTVFQKSAESAWKSALSNTADALDEYIVNAYDTEQKGFKVDGEFKVSSPIAVDGSVEGQWYETDGSMKADFGAGGARFDAEIRTIASKEGTTPDLYFKVDGLDGLDSLMESLGATDVSGLGSSLSTLNNQWFFVDHTLLDQASASSGSEGMEVSEKELKEIADKVSAVLRDRMFTTTQEKAIFTIKEKIGKEDFEGLSTHKIKVGIDKDNFKEFVTALKDALKDTKAEDLLKAGQEDKTLEEVLSFEDMLKELDDADFSKATADVWVEAGGAYIRNVRFYPVEGKEDSNYLDFGMDYKGGDVFPFEIKATIDDEGSKGTFTIGFEVNKTNGDAKMTMDLDMDMDGGSVKASGKIAISGSNDKVEVEKPEDAQNIFELMSGLQQDFTTDFSDYDYGTYDPSLYEDLDPSLYDDMQLQ